MQLQVDEKKGQSCKLISFMFVHREHLTLDDVDTVIHMSVNETVFIGDYKVKRLK